MTKTKQELINECIMLSRETEGVVYYGIICKNGTTQVTSHKSICEQYLECGDKLYCKAQDGYMVL